MVCNTLDNIPYDSSIEIDYGRFVRLPKDQKLVLNDWFEQAWKLRESPPEHHFHAWMLSWDLLGYVAEIITGSSSPASWFPILLNEPKLGAIFNGVMENKKSLLRMYAKRFALSWPIFDSEEIIHLSGGRTFSAIRAEKAQEYIKLGARNFAPPCWQDHLQDAEFIPDWKHTMSSWYAVRNNLFRPGGWQQSETDIRIVSNAFLSLIYFFKEGKIFFENPSLSPDIFDRTQVLSSL